MNENTTTLIVRIPVGLKRMLESCAEEKDLTSSQIVRNLIREYCKKNYVGDLFAQESSKKKR